MCTLINREHLREIEMAVDSLSSIIEMTEDVSMALSIHGSATARNR